MIYFLIIGIIFILCIGLWFMKLTDKQIAKELLKQKQLTKSFNNNVQLLNTIKAQRKPYIAKGKK